MKLVQLLSQLLGLNTHNAATKAPEVPKGEFAQLLKEKGFTQAEIAEINKIIATEQQDRKAFIPSAGVEVRITVPKQLTEKQGDLVQKLRAKLSEMPEAQSLLDAMQQTDQVGAGRLIPAKIRTGKVAEQSLSELPTDKKEAAKEQKNSQKLGKLIPLDDQKSAQAVDTKAADQTSVKTEIQKDVNEVAKAQGFETSHKLFQEKNSVSIKKDGATQETPAKHTPPFSKNPSATITASSQIAAEPKAKSPSTSQSPMAESTAEGIKAPKEGFGLEPSVQKEAPQRGIPNEDNKSQIATKTVLATNTQEKTRQAEVSKHASKSVENVHVNAELNVAKKEISSEGKRIQINPKLDQEAAKQQNAAQPKRAQISDAPAFESKQHVSDRPIASKIRVFNSEKVSQPDNNRVSDHSKPQSSIPKSNTISKDIGGERIIQSKAAEKSSPEVVRQSKDISADLQLNNKQRAKPASDFYTQNTKDVRLGTGKPSQIQYEKVPTRDATVSVKNPVEGSEAKKQINQPAPKAEALDSTSSKTAKLDTSAKRDKPIINNKVEKGPVNDFMGIKSEDEFAQKFKTKINIEPRIESTQPKSSVDSAENRATTTQNTTSPKTEAKTVGKPNPQSVATPSQALPNEINAPEQKLEIGEHNAKRVKTAVTPVEIRSEAKTQDYTSKQKTVILTEAPQKAEKAPVKEASNSVASPKNIVNPIDDSQEIKSTVQNRTSDTVKVSELKQKVTEYGADAKSKSPEKGMENRLPEKDTPLVSNAKNAPKQHVESTIRPVQKASASEVAFSSQKTTSELTADKEVAPKVGQVQKPEISSSEATSVQSKERLVSSELKIDTSRQQERNKPLQRIQPEPLNRSEFAPLQTSEKQDRQKTTDFSKIDPKNQSENKAAKTEINTAPRQAVPTQKETNWVESPKPKQVANEVSQSAQKVVKDPQSDIPKGHHVPASSKAASEPVTTAQSQVATIETEATVSSPKKMDKTTIEGPQIEKQVRAEMSDSKQTQQRAEVNVHETVTRKAKSDFTVEPKIRLPQNQEESFKQPIRELVSSKLDVQPPKMDASGISDKKPVEPNQPVKAAKNIIDFPVLNLVENEGSKVFEKARAVADATRYQQDAERIQKAVESGKEQKIVQLQDQLKSERSMHQNIKNEQLNESTKVGIHQEATKEVQKKDKGEERVGQFQQQERLEVEKQSRVVESQKQHAEFGSNKQAAYGNESQTLGSKNSATGSADDEPVKLRGQSPSFDATMADKGINPEIRLNPVEVVKMQEALARALRTEQYAEWHRQRIVMDDGRSLNVRARKQGEVLQLQLMGSQSELNKLAQQHASDIRQYLEQQLGTKVELQFDQADQQTFSGGNQAFDNQQAQQNQANATAQQNRQGFGNGIEPQEAGETGQATNETAKPIDGWIG